MMSHYIGLLMGRKQFPGGHENNELFLRMLLKKI